MVDRKIARDATTEKGFIRRVTDARFEKLVDPRDSSWVKHPLGSTLSLGVMALASGARSTRSVEERSTQLRGPVRRAIGLERRVSDNAFGGLLGRLDPVCLRAPLHRQVKAEWKRGRLRPEDGPLNRSSVAIDGKHVATIPEKRLRSLISQRTDLDGQQLDADELRRVLSTQFPNVQLQESTGGLCGLMRVHRATLISSKAAVVIDQWPLKGATNEEGTIRQTLRGLFSAYGRTNIVEMVTADAGNATPKAAELIQRNGADYFLALKHPQGQLYAKAVDCLGGLTAGQADLSVSQDERGKRICHTLWAQPIEETFSWQGAQWLVRIERVVADDAGVTTIGNRYFVTSVRPVDFDAAECLALARSHWRCENEGHWTADAIWDEDARRTPWTQHPDGILVVGILRAIAMNILAVLRALSRLKQGSGWRRPTWQTVIEQALLVLCEPRLDMEAFNTFDD